MGELADGKGQGTSLQGRSNDEREQPAQRWQERHGGSNNGYRREERLKGVKHWPCNSRGGNQQDRQAEDV